MKTGERRIQVRPATISHGIGEGFGRYHLVDDAAIGPHIDLAMSPAGPMRPPMRSPMPPMRPKCVRPDDDAQNGASCKKHAAKVGAYPPLPDLQALANGKFAGW